MFDAELISKELSGVVGLYRGFNSTNNRPALFHTKAPLFYLSDAHKLLRPDILQAVGPNITESFGNPFSLTGSYSIYEIVAAQVGQQIKFFESQKSENTGNPITDTAAWKETTELSAWYSQIERGAIAKICLDATSSSASMQMMDNQHLFYGEGNINETINKEGRFVYLSLQFARRSIVAGIVRLGVQLSGPVSDVPLYIFKDDEAEPVKVGTLNSTTAGRTAYADINFDLHQYKGGYYMLGYFEDDLPANVFAVGSLRSYNLTQDCSGCYKTDYAYLQNRWPYLRILPGYVQNPADNGFNTWAPHEQQVMTGQNFGINMLINVTCDVTQQLITHKSLFTRALLYSVACDVLEELSTSDRVNAIAEDVKSQAYVALNGQGNSKTDTGLKTDKLNAITDLMNTLAKVNPLCMAQEEPDKGVSFGSVFD